MKYRNCKFIVFNIIVLKRGYSNSISASDFKSFRSRFSSVAGGWLGGSRNFECYLRNKELICFEVNRRGESRFGLRDSSSVFATRGREPGGLGWIRIWRGQRSDAAYITKTRNWQANSAILVRVRHVRVVKYLLVNKNHALKCYSFILGFVKVKPKL